MSSEQIHLKRLQNNCSVTLERYKEVAQATCEMFGTLRKLPVSKDRRLAIYLQKKREDEALAAYQKSARGLLAVLEIQPDVVDSETAPQPLQAALARGARLNTSRRGIARNGN